MQNDATLNRKPRCGALPSERNSLRAPSQSAKPVRCPLQKKTVLQLHSAIVLQSKMRMSVIFLDYMAWRGSYRQCPSKWLLSVGARKGWLFYSAKHYSEIKIHVTFSSRYVYSQGFAEDHL